MWKLSLIALPQLSVQALWCFLGPNSAPYMQRMGAGDAIATFTTVSGPLVGFFTGPLVGVVSDKSTSKMGRRRPVIWAGLLAFWVAGMSFASTEHLLGHGGMALVVAVFFRTIMDVTINVLQTPHRALVADLAADDQQVPCQVVFTILMAIGNYFGGWMMTFFPNALDQMFLLMGIVCLLNTFTCTIQFLVAKETPLETSDGNLSFCAPVKEVASAAVTSPKLLYQLFAVNVLVWIGLTVWNNFGLQFFGISVYGGDPHEDASEEATKAYEEGQKMFGQGIKYKALVQLVSSFVIMGLVQYCKCIPPRVMYAPWLLGGAVVSLLAAFVVGTNGTLAMICLCFSVLPEVGSFAIPYGLVAAMNKQAVKQGKEDKTALQLALLNSCITVGQELCILAKFGIEIFMPTKEALTPMFAAGGSLFTAATLGVLFVDDDVEGDDSDGSDSDSD